MEKVLTNEDVSRLLTQKAGKLIGVGSVSGGEESAEIQLENGAVIEIRGISRADCRDLVHALYERVYLTIERAPNE